MVAKSEDAYDAFLVSTVAKDLSAVGTATLRVGDAQAAWAAASPNLAAVAGDGMETLLLSMGAVATTTTVPRGGNPRHPKPKRQAHHLKPMRDLISRLVASHHAANRQLLLYYKNLSEFSSIIAPCPPLVSWRLSLLSSPKTINIG